MARVRPEPPETTSAEAEPAPLARRPAPGDDAARKRARDGGARAAKGSAKRRPVDPPSARPQLGQVLTLVGLAGSAFVALSLASWSPSDPSLSVAGGGSVVNWCGPVGAYAADALYQAFGWASWSVLVVGAWLVLKLAGRVSNSLWNALLGSFALWMCATALDLGLGHELTRAFPPGGLLGVVTGDLLVDNVGRVGGSLGVATGLLSALTVLFGINWQPVAAATVERIQTGTPAVGRLLGAATVAAGRGAATLGSRATEALRSRLSPEDEEEPEEEADDLGEEEYALATVGPAPASPAPRLPAVREAASATRRAPPLDEVVEPVPDLPSAHGSVWSAAAPPRPRVAIEGPPVEKPTLLSARALVEVEFDDTDAPEVGTRRGSEGRAPAVAPAAGRAPAPDDYDIPAPRVRPSQPGVAVPAAIFAEDDELDVLDDVPPPAPAFLTESDPPTNAFGFGAPAEDPPTRPSVAAPAPAVPPPVVPTVLIPPDVEQVDLFAAKAPKGRRGAAVVPGNLASGGKHDDGTAIRVTNQPFQLPPLGLLDEHPEIVGAANESRLHDLAARLTAKLKDFGVEGRVSAIRPGPVITMFEYEPAPGIKLSKIASLSDDVAMAIKALAVRIVAPLPGRGVVGVEVPNDVRQTVWARDVFASNEFRSQHHILPIMLGKDTEGRPYVADLAKTPHLLVGGTTGSGKSVGINAMLVSLLMTRTPEELRLILVDPKMLEFELYKDIPHLLHPVVTNATLASKVLAWACEEMDRRYRMLGDWKVRNIENFNQKVEHESKEWNAEKARSYFPDWPEGQLLPTPKKLPYIVVVIDELADLMMVAGKDVETSIARIAQKARASGIHLIVATQRPSADVITGLIRSNMPSRLAYQVRTATESRIILDAMGANALLGKGDLLFVPPGVSALTRIHGPFLSDEEVKRVADFCRAQGKPAYAPAIRIDDADDVLDELEELDEEMARYYDEIVELALEKGQISTSMIQRHLKLGYNRACLLMEQLEKQGIVGPADGARPRKVLAQE